MIEYVTGFEKNPLYAICAMHVFSISSSGPNSSKSRFCHIDVNPSCNCSRRLWRLIVSYKGEISLHFYHTGKDNSLDTSEIGATYAVVPKLLEGLEGRGHHIYIGNYYSTSDLFGHLQRLASVHVVQLGRTREGCLMR